MNKIVVIADSSQIAKFSECPMLWHYDTEENLIPVQQVFSSSEKEPDTVKMDARSMGTYGHKILELYYLGKIQGLDGNQAITNALNWKKWITSLPKQEAITVNECILKLGPKNIEFINERLRLYTWTYASNDYNPRRLEVGFSHNLYEDDKYLFVLEGRIDLLGNADNGVSLFEDHKLQLTRKSLYKRSIQFRNYALVTGELFGVINYIRMAKNVDQNTFVREPISFSALEMTAWKEELIQIYFQMANCTERRNGLNGSLNPIKTERICFPRHRASCAGKFNYPCIYTELCDEPQADLVQIKKKTMYTEKQPWKPWHEEE